MANKFTIIEGNKESDKTERTELLLKTSKIWERQYNNAVYSAINSNKGKDVPD